MLLSITTCLLFCVPVFSLDLPPIYAKILDELSWTLKLKLLKDFTDATSTSARPTTTTISARRVGLEALVIAESVVTGNIVDEAKKTKEKSIYINNALAEKDPSEYLGGSRFNDMKIDNEDGSFDSIYIEKSPENGSIISATAQKGDSRRYFMNRNKNTHFMKSNKDPKFFAVKRLHGGKDINDNYSKFGRRQEEDVPYNVAPPTETIDDENNMRMKLFRLMYETVRDSDLKVKRAELIKTHYHNSSAFDIGYLMGDITDKYNIMHDIAMTLERLYHVWKPLEHINAYEQIANQAIQINHLIDMVRHINKRNESNF